MRQGLKYVKYDKECPFCKATVTNLLGCNLFCECGAKYYFFEHIWLNRKTGEKVFEKENNDVQT